jgi:HAD superfamily hydrolase (TIGR01484 family)
MTSPKPIKLLITDVDGCLIQGEKAPYDLDALAAIRELNQAAAHDPTIPAVTICSGRPYPYVEAMLKLVDGHLPAVFEHGCGLYYPARELRHECAYHPQALRSPDQRSQLEALVARIEQETGAGRQCAKGALVTFFPPPDHSPAAFATYVADTIAQAGLPLEVGHTMTSVDVAPLGIDKLVGVEWLLQELRGEGWEIAMDQVAAVGDSPSDLCVLQPAGLSAAPANADAVVRAAVDYVSPERYTRGVLDVLQRAVALNRAIA